jgi:hypothetical protein
MRFEGFGSKQCLQRISPNYQEIMVVKKYLSGKQKRFSFAPNNFFMTLQTIFLDFHEIKFV